MTALVLGVVVGAVGQYFGVPFAVGFLVGSTIGGLIDPPKAEGPKIMDLKLQVSSYGKMIPFVWGRGRLAGNVIDQTDLTHHGGGGGGKGGGEPEAESYTASFDILLCAKTPDVTQAIAGISKCWGDGRLVWSEGSGEPPPFTIYFGSDDQEPDPTFEAIHGVGNVPAYNGYAHVVFTDHNLADFGNRIPQWEFEVFTLAGTFPWRVSTFEVNNTGFTLRAEAATLDGGVITIGYGSRASWYAAHYIGEYLVDGTVVTPIYETDVGSAGARTYKNKLHWNDGILYAPDGVTQIGTVVDGVGLHGSPLFVSLVVGTGSPDWVVAGTTLAGAVIRSDSGAFASLFNMGSNNVPPTDDGSGGLIYKAYVNDRNDSPTNVWLHELDVTVGPAGSVTSVTLNRTWDMANQQAIESIFNGASFAVYQNNAGRLVLACDRGQAGSKQIYCFYLNADLTTTAIAGVNYGSIFGQTNPIALLGGGPYLLTGDGVINLEPPANAVLLSDIVGSLSKDFNDGTSIVAHDVTELTDEVRWFAIASIMTRRNAISVLRPAFFFDAVESDDVVVFRKRGSSSIATITEDDLCARSEGEDAGDPLRTIRRKEQGLPRTVTMRYYDVDADYQIGAQSSPRVTTLSESEVVLDLPIGFTAGEAQQKCWSIQVAEWIEREEFEWSLPKWYAYLEPCDVVNVRGRVIRITKRTEKPDGVLLFGGVLEAPSIYTQTAPASTGGFTPQLPPSDSVPTELVLLDIPVLSQSAYRFGFYAAMGPLEDGRWTGATLYKSLDDGTSYNAIASTMVQGVIGVTQSSPGSPTVTGVLAPYFGGDVVDESEICVVLTDDDATLSSITAASLTNGGGLVAISRGLSVGSPNVMEWEVLGVRDWTMIGTRTFIGKGMLRARKGTYTTNHSTGDTFVLLSTAVNVDAPVEELNRRLLYKAVSFGRTLNSATSQYFTNTGKGADWYYNEELNHIPPFTGASGGSPSTGGWQGLVPAPGAGDCEAGKFLSACGDWRVPPTGSSGGYVNGPNDWMFGSGIDGAAHLDGTNTVHWASKVGSVYSMISLPNLTDLTIDAGVTLVMQGMSLWVKNTLDNDGTIHSNGANAVTSVAGVGGGAANRIWAPGTGGGNGGIVNGVVGGAITAPATGGGGVGGTGGSGNAGVGAAGGAIPFPAGPTGANPQTSFGSLGLYQILFNVDGYASLGSTVGGGTGGGGGGGANPQAGGGGGGGASAFLIAARLIVGTGTISARGGNGGNPGTNSGGGSGGGGGLIYIVTTSATYAATMTVTVAGGTGIAGNGAGTAGANGSAGRLIEFFV